MGDKGRGKKSQKITDIIYDYYLPGINWTSIENWNFGFFIYTFDRTTNFQLNIFRFN